MLRAHVLWEKTVGSLCSVLLGSAHVPFATANFNLYPFSVKTITVIQQLF